MSRSVLGMLLLRQSTSTRSQKTSYRRLLKVHRGISTRFSDYREKVAQIYPQLDLSNITIDKELKEEASSTREVATEELIMETAKVTSADEATEELANPEELAK